MKQEANYRPEEKVMKRKIEILLNSALIEYG
jgi:hypothetical protein